MTLPPLSPAELQSLSDRATPGPWRADYDGFLRKEDETRVNIGADIPCINGLSAIFTLATLHMPDEAEEGMTDGARNRDRVYADAAFIVACVNGVRSGALALAAPAGESADPVAWELIDPDGGFVEFSRRDPCLSEEGKADGWTSRPLYAAPPAPVAAQSATRASAPSSAPGGWQDIATAPRDGTDVLVAIPSGGVGPNYVQAVAAMTHGKWQDDSPFGELYTPTHWQPLPAPPSAPASRTGGAS